MCESDLRVCVGKLMHSSVVCRFTMLQMMVSRDQGLISLDEPVVKQVPAFGIRNPYGPHPGAPSKVTYRQLATHMAGLPRESPCSGLACDITQQEALERVTQMTAILPTDTLPVYSNLGFNVLGNSLAQIHKMPYADLINKTIIEPLGLANTGVDITTADRKHLAMPYSCDLDGLDPSNAACVFPQEIYNCTVCLQDFGWGDPAGAMYSSANDLGKVMSLIFRDQASVGSTPGQILDGASIRETLLPRFIQSDRQGGFGMTWELYNGPSGYWLRTKRGDVPGYASEIMMVPELKLGIVALSNVVEHAQSAAQAMAQILVPAFDTADQFRNPTDNPAPPLDLAAYAGTYSQTFPNGGHDYERVVLDGQPGQQRLISPASNNVLQDSVLVYVDMALSKSYIAPLFFSKWLASKIWI